MKRFVLLVAAVLIAGGCKKVEQKVVKDMGPKPAPVVITGPFTGDELARYAALEPIDSHAHAYAASPDFLAMLKRTHIHMVDILVIDDQSKDYKSSPSRAQDIWKFVKASGGHAVFCTSFDPYKFADANFAANTNRGLNRDFSQGAVAVKIWKNIGMEIKDANGNYLLPDDPVFAPIYKDIAAHHKTLIAHLADPSSSWSPLDPASPDYDYYTHNPVWYMYGKKNAASKEKILKARDHVLEQNPDLKVVGAHLGSMEANFHHLADRLDRYPNFAVDMAARMPYIMLNPRDDMIAFLTKYQDRLLYATDEDFGPNDDGKQAAAHWEEVYARDWRFLATDDWVEYNGRKVHGLALPPEVLKKIYHDNAVRWIPGVAGK